MPKRCSFGSAAVSFCALLAGLAYSARADQIILKNGKTLSGEVSAEDDRTVTLEVTAPGITFTQRISKAQISSWDRPKAAGKPYVLIPVIGGIGTEMTAAALKPALIAAIDAKPRYIVLVIDSGGGSIAEMAKMIDLLDAAPKDVEIIAYVQHAYSAAAVLALSCRQIYMKPDSAIGAMVPYKMTKDGPADIEAKFRSPIEAACRQVAVRGGHSDLLVRGMIEMDLQLVLSKEDGNPILHTSGPGKIIKSKGHILTLTADEAAECGLAHVAADIGDVGKQVAGGEWHEATHRPWNIIAANIEQQHRQAARQAAVQRIAPEFNSIEARVTELAAKYATAQAALDDLTSRCNDELKEIDAQYKEAAAQAAHQKDAKAALAQAAEAANARIAQVRQNYQNGKAVLTADAEAARLAADQLRARQKQLVASVPYE